MVSADGRFIASHGDDGMILVWALSQTGEPIAEIEVGEYNPYISFAPYSATFAYATEEGFGVFDCEEKKEIASTKHAMPGEFRLRFDTDPRFVVVIDISEDHVGIFLWEWQRSNRVHNVQEPRQITGIVRTLTAGKIMYQTLDFDPNSGLSTTLVVLDLDTLKTEDIATIETGAYLLAFQVYDASGRHISIAHYPGKPTKLAVGDQSLTTYIVAQPEHELRVGVGRAGKVFIAAGDDGYVRLWRE
ncbi:MAG: WD40 repeat domain-containing protein [Armatimonadetes bacterium]|nr:WD40 repeat domain-containing protein [Armatimonadota bacterium]